MKTAYRRATMADRNPPKLFQAYSAHPADANAQAEGASTHDMRIMIMVRDVRY